MQSFRFSRAVAMMAACICWATSSQAAYPDHLVKIIVPVAPGGSLDTVGRLSAEYLKSHFGGSFVVENKAGANTAIGSTFVSKAAADGYALLINTDASVTASLATSGLKVDPVTELAPVSMIVSSPAVLVVRPDLGVKTLPEFIALARARPLNVASTGTGTASHFTGLMFKHTAGVDWADIPFSGSGPALQALLGGQVDAMWSMAAPLLPSIKAGKIVPLAVTSAAPSAQLPQVATVDSLFPGFVVNNWMGLFAPPGTPEPVLKSLSKALADMTKDARYASRLRDLGFEPVGGSPGELEAEVKSSLAKWKSVLSRQK